MALRGRFELRVGEEEMGRWREAAAGSGMALADWVRSACAFVMTQGKLTKVVVPERVEVQRPVRERVVDTSVSQDPDDTPAFLRDPVRQATINDLRAKIAGIKP